MTVSMWVAPVISTIVAFVVGGLLATASKVFRGKTEKDIFVENAVKALTHDSFFRYCRYLLKEGYVTAETSENLEHLYKAYHALGLNGTGDKLKAECDKLPIR